MNLRFKERLSYALGAVGKDMAYALASSYVLYYYQDVLGVDAWIMGVILAKTHTRWGRFRPC